MKPGTILEPSVAGLGKAEVSRWVLTSDRGELSLSSSGSRHHPGGETRRWSRTHGRALSLLDGYVLARRSSPLSNTSYEGSALVREAWRRFRGRFTDHLKGVFSILILDGDGAHVFTDHLGVRKVFYTRRPTGFVISNSLAGVLDEVDAVVDPVSPALNALLHHYVGGWTCFKDVRFSGPAASLSGLTELTVSQYWRPDSLLKLSPVSVDYGEFADEMVRLMGDHLRHLDVRSPSLTLTGGMDSRTLLALLIRNGVHPRTFTFGDPASSDAVVATEIASRCGLVHSVHRPPVIEARWFGEMAQRITDIGDSLTHIHRAHRLDGVLREVAAGGDIDALFLGCMGGEGIRGLHIDDLIVTRFVREMWGRPEARETMVDAHLDHYWIRRDRLDRAELLERLEALSCFQGPPKHDEFRVLFELVAGLHHGQDVNLYGRYVKNVVPFFMDVDYLELLFSSPYSMLHKRNTSRNPLKRLNIPAFNSNVLHHLNPELAAIPLANGYSPDDYLAGRLRYLVQRMVHRATAPPRVANFAVQGWIREYVQAGLAELRSPLTATAYAVERAQQALVSDTPPAGERPWRRFSDIIAADLVFDRFMTKRSAPRRPLPPVEA